MCSVLYESSFMINRFRSLCCIHLRRRPIGILHCVAVHDDGASLERLEWDIRGVSGFYLNLAHPSPQTKHTDLQHTGRRGSQCIRFWCFILSLAFSSYLFSCCSVAYIDSEKNTWMSDSESGWLISWVADFMANCVFPCCVVGALS